MILGAQRRCGDQRSDQQQHEIDLPASAHVEQKFRSERVIPTVQDNAATAALGKGVIGLTLIQAAVNLKIGPSLGRPP
jgi:hypothetical protein